MMRSLFTGVAGLKTHQTRMDVIGNNIANVNTAAYKSQSMTFSDLMYQTTQSASGANAETGRAGINATQIGLGSKTSSITTAIESQGGAQSTGYGWDIMINGNAFFVVSDGANNYFTRSGAFYLDGAGNLAMRSNGYTVMGWQADQETQTIIQDTVSPLRLKTPENMTADPEATTEGFIKGILDKNADGFSNGEGVYTTMGFYDNLGYSYNVKFQFQPVLDANGAPVEGQYTLGVTDILDSDGDSIAVRYWQQANVGNNPPTADTPWKDYSPEQKEAAREAMLNALGFGGTAGQNGTLTVVFDTTKDGKLQNVYPGANPAAPPLTAFNFDLNGLSGMFPGFTDMNISIDMATTKNVDNKGTPTVSGESGNAVTGLGKGRKVGAMDSITVQQDGKIYASYDNGQTRLLGQIAVARFANPSGLQKEGDNLYSATLNSGIFNGIGADITANGRDSMSSGYLEMSNVDLSAEFTEMITTQRGFQANSRIITVSDTLLEELINLKR
ncbi:MAG: flagellar hook protein FlgE [Lachnospiraceae bacterium]|jgi:flagellar hook protein FlgE|nr:flagellar hook protein FlgE [Lachnospiraceae bacterium]